MPRDPAQCADDAPARPSWRLALLVRLDPRQAVLFPAGSHEPLMLARSAFDAACAPGHLRTAPAAAGGDATDDSVDASTGAAARGFGFRWFVPELARHRRVWRDVLVASFVVQLIALAVPLASQTIIDKVIVHRTPSTLAVIAAALFAGILFSSALGWIRQVLVVHTGNRVDAVLGSAVFAHLIRLPAAYFERRPTGVLAARMNGIETIREFLSGTAVTVVLDVPFLGLFVALMLAYSVPLSIVALALLGLLVVVSVAFAPRFQACFDAQFLLGARAGLHDRVRRRGRDGQVADDGASARASLRDFARRYLRRAVRHAAPRANLPDAGFGLEQTLRLRFLARARGWSCSGPGLHVGMLVAFQMFAARVSQPMLKLVGLWQQFQQATIAVRRLADILDVPAEPHGRSRRRGAGGAGRLELRAVSYRYAATGRTCCAM